MLFLWEQCWRVFKCGFRGSTGFLAQRKNIHQLYGSCFPLKEIGSWKLKRLIVWGVVWHGDRDHFWSISDPVVTGTEAEQIHSVTCVWRNWSLKVLGWVLLRETTPLLSLSEYIDPGNRLPWPSREPMLCDVWGSPPVPACCWKD